MGRTYIFNEEINKHALMITTTEEEEVRFSISFFCRLYIVDLLLQHEFLLCKSD